MQCRGSCVVAVADKVTKIWGYKEETLSLNLTASVSDYSRVCC